MTMRDGIFYRGSSHLGQPSLEEPDYQEEDPITDTDVDEDDRMDHDFPGRYRDAE